MVLPAKPSTESVPEMLNQLVSPIDLYSAAKETCVRLYVANGGNKRDHWTVQPFPGTAAISRVPDYNKPGAYRWVLCMPALPLDVRVPRWQADLIAGYTVHELCHAIMSDWNVIAMARNEGLQLLHNAIEDNRIEARATRGDLLQVSEARRLLEALNRHIYDKAVANPAFDMRDPKQFAFVLNLVIFREKLGYAFDFPADWRKRLPANSVTLIEHALDRFDSLVTCEDALILARELKAMAEAQKQACDNPKDGEDSEDSEAGQDGEKAEGQKVNSGRKAGEKPEGRKEGQDGEKAESQEAGEKAEGQDGEKAEGQDGEKAEGQDGAGTSQDGQDGQDGEDTGEDTGQDGEAGQRGQEGQETAGAGDRGTSEGATLDLGDSAQAYSEANLNDLGSMDPREHQALQPAFNVINAPASSIRPADARGNPRNAAAVIESGAKVRRHVTLAVKSPERVANERFQTSGRIDLRNMTGLAIGADNVFRRRIEDEGREAAVSLLIDTSDSMRGGRIAAARALALHMGDALKAAGVRFEIASFRSGTGTAIMTFPKAFAQGWNDDTRSATAGMPVIGGTAMMPAIKTCAERLVKVTAVSRRILMVLTDGADSWSPEANAAMCKLCRNKGVEVIGIGLLLDPVGEAPACLEAFAGNAIMVDDCAKLSSAGLAELVKQLDKAAPKSA